MKEYHKIDSVFKRDERGRFIEGEWSREEFAYLAGNEWEWTEKVDGTNIRVMWDGIAMKRTFGGKTDNAQIPPHLFARLEELFPVEKFYGLGSMCLYGEGYGVKIQKGGGNYGHVDFVLFDVAVDTWWLKRDAVSEIGERLGVKVVPVVGKGTLSEAIEYTRAGFSSQWGDFSAEGLVMRPIVPLRARSGERIITKVKTRDFRRV